MVKIVRLIGPFYDGVMLTALRSVLTHGVLALVLVSFGAACSSSKPGRHVEVLAAQGAVTYAVGDAAREPVQQGAVFDVTAGGRLFIPAHGELLVLVRENQRVAYLRAGEVKLSEMYALEQPPATRSVDEQIEALTDARQGTGAQTERVAAFQAGQNAAETVGVVARDETGASEESAPRGEAPLADEAEGGGGAPQAETPPPTKREAVARRDERMKRQSSVKGRGRAADAQRNLGTAPPPVPEGQTRAPPKQRKIVPEGSGPEARSAPLDLQLGPTPSVKPSAQPAEPGAGPFRLGGLEKADTAVKKDAAAPASTTLKGGMQVRVTGGTPALRAGMIKSIAAHPERISRCRQLSRLTTGTLEIRLVVDARGVRQGGEKPSCLEKALWAAAGKVPERTRLVVTFSRDPKTLRTLEGR